MNLKLQSKSKTIYVFLMALFSVWGLGQSITINLSSAGGSGNLGSTNYNNGAERTWVQGGVSFAGKAITAGNGGNTGLIQTQAANGVIYNTTPIPGRIKTIQVIQDASSAFTLSGGSTTRLVNSTGGSYTVTGGTAAGSVTGVNWTSVDLSTQNYSFFVLKKGSGTAYISSIVITYELATTPSFSTTGTFGAFSYIEGNGPSASQSVSVSGSNLDNSAVTVTAPNNYEVSLTGGNDFADSKTISYSGGGFTSQNVYARLKSGLVFGTYSGNIVISGGSVAANTNIAVSGNVTTVPIVTASTFTGAVGSIFSHNIVATQNPTSYALVSGSNLPAGLTLNTTTGEISGTPTSAGIFTTDVTASNASGVSTAKTITIIIDKGTQVLTGFTDTTKYLSSSAFTYPVNTSNANLTVAYTSSNPAIATVSGNTVTITGLGTTNITATQAGDSNWNSYNQQIVLTVVNDPVTYNGVGRFEKITSVSDITDGYYVVTNETDAFLMTNSRDVDDLFFTSASSNASSDIIVNPSVNNVWLIQSNGTNTRTIYNEAIQRYVGWQSGNTASSEITPANSNRWTFTYVSGRFTVNNFSTPGRQLSYNTGAPRFAAYGNANQQELQLFKRIETTIWNGTSWSNGTPDAKDVIIAGAYTTSVTTPAFNAKNITIQNGGVLEITSGNTIDAMDVTVEDGGNLIQKDGSTLSYSGAFKALKNGASEINKYAFWTSPVVDQTLANIYTGATPISITEYNTANDSYVNAASISVFGKGYSIKTPISNAALVFEGAPNNGTQTFTLSTSGNRFNLIGNPYPSNLSLGAFYTANSARISSTFYFWDNKSTNVMLQNGATTTNYGYATFNAANGANPTWVPAPNGNGGTVVVPIGDVANIGQGFIVKALNTSIDTSLTFNNEMRGATNATFFNKNNSSTEGKFWLRLSSDYNTNNTFAVDYINGASDSFDNYDSKAIGMGSDGFYTLADAQKLIIQGKESFDINDVVPIGVKHFQNGNFTIALVQKEGLFNDGQAIYLHDKAAGTYTNLQNGAYWFTANAGESTNRFEIVYKLNVLATAEVLKDSFEVYRDGQDFVVRNNKNIEKVEIFDAAGRKIQTINENTKLVRVQLTAKGVYILKALSDGKEYTKKIIK